MTNTLAIATGTAVILGKVTERKGARLHLDTAGRAHCGAGRGTIAADTRRQLDGDADALTVCRRCIKAIRAALAAILDAAAAAGGMMTPAEAIARDAANLFATPAERAARQAEIAAGIRAAARAKRAAQDEELARIAAGSWDHRERLLAELANMPVPAGFEDYADAA
jgi:hypothetical protein